MRKSLEKALFLPVVNANLLPVQSDGEEVEDGGGAAEDVTGGPHVTQERTEYPGAADLGQREVNLRGKLHILVGLLVIIYNDHQY